MFLKYPLNGDGFKSDPKDILVRGGRGEVLFVSQVPLVHVPFLREDTRLHYRKVHMRLHGKGKSDSHGARPVY